MLLRRAPLRIESFAATLGAIAFVGLALRLLYILTLADDHNVSVPHGDRFFFVEGARALADGHGFPYPIGFVFGGHNQPSAAHPPLWTMVLALPATVGIDGYTAARIVGALVGSVMIVMFGLLGRQIANERAGMLAAAAAAAYPVFIAADTSGKSETLYLTFVAALVLFVLRARDSAGWTYAAAAGLCAGLAALTRTEGLVILVLVGLPALWGLTRPRWRLPAVALLTAAAVIAPWTARNWISLGAPVLVSTNEATVIAGANCHETYFGPEKGSWSPFCQLRASGPIDLANYDEAAVSSKLRKSGLRYAADHPVRLAAVAGVRVLRTWRLWQPVRRGRLSEGENIRFATVGLVVFFVLVLPLGILGARRAPLRRDHLLILGGLVLVVCLVSAAGSGSPRFARPGELALILFASTWVANWQAGRGP